MALKFVIKDVNLYQGLIDSLIVEHSNVYVDGERIVKIDNNDVTDEGYEVIDGKGKYLLPGLINLHVHMFGSGKPSKILGGGSLQQYVIKAASTEVGRKVLKKILAKNMKDALYSGVTTLRAVGDFFYSDLEIRDLINDNKLIGPTILASGPAITVPSGHGDKTFALTGSTNEELVNIVEQNASHNVDLIKICITGGVMDAKVKGEPGEVKMSLEMAKAICDKAHELNYMIASHTESKKGVEIAVKSGVDTIEHGSIFDDDTARLMKNHNTAFVCTLSPALPLASFDPKITKLNSMCVYNAKVVFDNMVEGISKALRYYIPVGLGTDSSCPFVSQYNMWREIYYFAKYLNVSNSFALYTATLQNAIILKMEKDIGSIETGKIADMIMVDNDPLVDLKALKDIHMVISKGKIYKDCKIKKDEKMERELDKLL